VRCDLLILGSGIAGLRAALEASALGWKVAVASKERSDEGSTTYAQGGIAAAMAPGDSPELHLADTLAAGDGLCDEEAVRTLVEEGPERVRELIAWGCRFDRREGSLHFTREAAHGRSRILHAMGDATGREIERTLADAAAAAPGVQMLPGRTGIELISEGGRCAGAWLLGDAPGEAEAVSARAVLLATGGIGRLYQESTNPNLITGDGMAMALRASAVLSCLEFVQFHPTALFLKDAPRFLLSESMRGEGATLRNATGDRFMARYHPGLELAPRDVVSRAIVREMKATRDRVFLDMTHLPAAFVRERFPTIHATLLRYGLDMTAQPVPIHPAAHYTMGGVATDMDGRTSVPGLYAAGENACTGVHGANRLASNSLLEGLVFGRRAARAAFDDAPDAPGEPPPAPPYPAGSVDLEALNGLRRQVASILWEGVGILRSATSLVASREELGHLAARIGSGLLHRRLLETRNMALLGDAIAISAEYRTESRGAHYREDFPVRDDARWRRPTYLVWKDGEYRFLGGETFAGARSEANAWA
jgi:L-aspartate oxidase